jgi:hypothetical protein
MERKGVGKEGKERKEMKGRKGKEGKERKGKERKERKGRKEGEGRACIAMAFFIGRMRTGNGLLGVQFGASGGNACTN